MSTPYVQSADRRARSNLIYAVVALVLAAISWIINPWFIPSLCGIIIAIWVLVRMRGVAEGPRTATKVVAIIAIVVGVLSVVGSLLLFAVPPAGA